MPAKKLIEVALPLKAINHASAREKSIRHGHPSTLHLWWARRPLASARAVIFSSLVDDPDDPQANPHFIKACNDLPPADNVKTNGDTPRMRLFDFIERLVTWENTTDEQTMNTARQLIRIATNNNPPPLLDPFAGGGSIPLEAQRLGLEAHASDLNPVAVMINKAMIEIPPRFANQRPVNPQQREQIVQGDWQGAAGLAADVRYYGEWMREQAHAKIGNLYPKHKGETVIAWLWARTVQCPNPACRATMPLVSSFDLSKKKDKRAWLMPYPDKHENKVRFEVQTGDGKPPESPKVGRGAKFKCLVCNEVAPDKHIKSESMAGRMGAQLTAIVTDGKHGRNYHSPTDEQVEIAESAKPKWKPHQEMNRDTTNIVSGRGYGFFYWSDLFTPRQLTALTTFSDLVSEARQRVYQDALDVGLPDDNIPLRDGGRGAFAYGEAVSVYLGMNVSKQANRTSSFCFWDSGVGNIQQVFARQAIPMIWDYPEGNPFSNSSGNFLGHLEYTLKVLERSPANPAGFSNQQDAAQINRDAITLSTDPPYYDNIGYADLSDFFYVWMRDNLRDIYPDIFSTMLVPKAQELIASRYRHNNSKPAASEYFESGMLETFTNIRKFVTDEYPLTVYYAFKQQDASFIKDGVLHRVSTSWETMLTSLIKAGFSIVGTWPMRTELSTGLKTRLNSLASSIILVCRPRPHDAPLLSLGAFLQALRRELPPALKAMQSGSIAPVDLAQASIGPGMAIYSRASRVLEADGSPIDIRTALMRINEELQNHLAQIDGDLDAESRFAIDWFKQHGFKDGLYGEAETLVHAKNTSVDTVKKSGLVISGGGKVRLKDWPEMEPGWDPQRDKYPTVWEAVHHLIERATNHGDKIAGELLSRMPGDMGGEVRDLAYRLYEICDREGWAEHAFYYNDFVVRWPQISEEALRHKRQPEQSALM